MDDVQLQTAEPQVSSRQEGANSARPKLWRRTWAIVAGGGLFLGLRYLTESLTYETTDDAFIDANFVTVSPRVAGQVTTVLAQRNHWVKAGDLLVEIDPKDLQAQLEQKQAAAAAAQANAELLKSSLDLSSARVASAEATAKQAAAEAAAAQATAQQTKADFQRAQDLIDNHTISPQEFDTAKSRAAAADAYLRAAQEKAASDQSKIAEAQAQLASSQKALARGKAQVLQAQADQHWAELNLSYARITAPVDGFVTRKAVEQGDYVQVGQNLLALVPREVFVTANFKETQLQHIRTNQEVRISIDSVAGGPFRGRVESIQAGSGAAFSLLPPENAVGNYVKVVQRVPVKVVFEAPVETLHRLGPGLSVEPAVHVADYEISPVLAGLAAGALAVVIGFLWWRLAARPPRSS